LPASSGDTPVTAPASEHSTKKHLVILGGGFAGANLAARVERRLGPNWEIYLLSEDNYLTYKPLLPEVVGATILPGSVLAPLRLLTKRVRVRMVHVESVDLEQKQVHYRGRTEGTLRYDHLVLACGQRPRWDLIGGMESFGYPLASVGDALRLRNRIVARLEQATIEPDADIRAWLLRFLVVGGGFSGVEVAGALQDLLCASVRYYKNVTENDCEVTIIHAGERLLPELSAKLGANAERSFRQRGIAVRLGERAVELSEDGATLASGSSLSAATVITTIGTAPQPLVKGLNLPTERGRVVTAGDLSVPQQPGVWALGDCALVPNARDGQASPPTAQFAERQARLLAHNIASDVAGKDTLPFSYRPRGQLAAIGHRRAVVQLPGFTVAGLPAWLLWRAFYLLRIPTVARKARLFLEWSWSMLFPPDIAHMNLDQHSVSDEASAQTHKAD
jgi:NADH:ubiquinone reductase (H+-translocating)